jgi:mercuric ion binding protein
MKPATALLAAILAATGSQAPLATAGPALAQSEAVTQTTVLSVENMFCELCPLTVKAAIERVPGVTAVVIDFEAKTATVTFDPTITSVEAIAATSTGVGYPAHVAGS